MPFDIKSLYSQSNELFGAIQRVGFKAANAVGANSEAVAKINTPVRTYQMRAGWYHRCWRTGGKIVGELANKCNHAIFPESGTGLWGPKHARIYPKHKKALSWIGSNGKRVFAGSIKGQPGQFIGRSAMFGQSALYLGRDTSRNLAIIERELRSIE